MVRSNLIIAGSNFIFSHIKNNYSKYLNLKKKFLVIFRGINVDYFDPSTDFLPIEKYYKDIFCAVITESRFAQPTANYSEKVFFGYPAFCFTIPRNGSCRGKTTKIEFSK